MIVRIDFLFRFSAFQTFSDFTENLRLKTIFSIPRKHVSLQFYVVNSRSHLINVISVIPREIMLKVASFSLKFTIKEENCHSQISCITQMVRSEITFVLVSRNTQCGNLRIFLSLRFYVKSILENL